MDSRLIKDFSDFIFVKDKPASADIIFIPGGSEPAVPEYAAQLYRDGYAPLLLPAGGVSMTLGKFPGAKRKQELYPGPYKTESAFYTDVLVKNQVPTKAILAEKQSRFTKENAFFSQKLLQENNLPIKKALLCCKSFHARRCFLFYTLAFPEVEILVCPVDVYGITKETWFQHKTGLNRVLGELSRCGEQARPELIDYALSLEKNNQKEGF